MESPKNESDKESENDSRAGNNENKKTGRRIQDAITSKNPSRKLNLDRRTARNERRANADPNYKGPSKRYNIDRRQNTKDRRDED